jgi:hypothetical protein
MLIFSISFPDLINFLTWWIHLHRRVWVKGGSKTLQIILVFTFTGSRVSVCDKYLHWPRVSVKIYIYTLRQDKCKCKKIWCVSDDLHLHWIYTPYIWLLTLTHTTLLFSYIPTYVLTTMVRYGTGIQQRIVSCTHVIHPPWCVVGAGSRWHLWSLEFRPTHS